VTDARDVVAEEAANQRYLKAMDEKVKNAGDRRTVAVARRAHWTQVRGSMPTFTEPTVAPLIGRVGLASVDPDVDADNFYIGPWYHRERSFVVYSWAAPVAGTFYRSGDHDLIDAVEVTRTFSVESDRIVGVDDEWLDGATPRDPAFAPGAALEVPAPPTAHRAPATPRRTSTPERTTSESSSTSPDDDRRGGSDRASDEPSAGPASRRGPQNPLRAEKVVRAALAAPRGESLASVLGTLQPDQYDLVTRDPRTDLVIEGHPGTGKTIIAVHRAAYLMHPDRTPQEGEGSRSPEHVLIVGPTASWRQHIMKAVEELNVGRSIDVRGLDPWLRDVSVVAMNAAGPTDGSVDDVSLEAFDEVERAVRAVLRARGTNRFDRPTRSVVEEVYRVLRRGATSPGPAGARGWPTPWAAALPELAQASRQARYLPAIAACALVAAPPRPQDAYSHIIVDEAQDVRPLEWALLGMLAGPDTGWTLIGDMNQRRTDTAFLSWSEISEAAGLHHEFEHMTLSRGYRSTKQIMDFANRLLPRDQRRLESLQQDGDPVVVDKVSRDRLVDACMEHIVHLAGNHPEGTVALIDVDARRFAGRLKQAGWNADPARSGWWERPQGGSLMLVSPVAARGLEFDGVLVVEPGDFPRNLGRSGPLFTSLTRANRELRVLHSKALPSELRRR
jgi:hypothetical protein